ncbi:MAG: ATP-grasp domain-containing protein [Parabacteroides sp.]|nr:ATP-grasp domain-containing protein [Parabacteroides sp.]
MENKDVVVVGGDHYNTLWVCRSLGLTGYKPTIIVLDQNKNKSFVQKTKYAKNSYVVTSCSAILEILLNLNFNKKVSIFSSSDKISDFLDTHYTLLSTKYYLANCNEDGSLSQWMDKMIMNEFAKKSGFKIPFSKEISLYTYNSMDLEDVKYPCIVKPLKSSNGSKLDFNICNNKNELCDSLKKIKENCCNVLIQEYLKPDFEISILCMRHRKSKINLIPGLLIKSKTCKSVYNLGMPAYAYTQKEIKPYVDTKVVDHFLNEIDYEGLYSIEFFVTKDTTYFLEINLRVDGDLFVYTQSGVNMPYLWDTLNQGDSIKDEQLDIKKRTYGMTEISYIKYLDWKHPIEAIKDWWRTDCYSIFSWSDIKPFIYKFIYATY